MQGKAPAVLCLSGFCLAFLYFTKKVNEELELQKHVTFSFVFCVGF